MQLSQNKKEIHVSQSSKIDPMISVQAHQNITPHPRRQVHLGFQIQLDTNHQRRVLELAVRPHGSLEEITWSAMLARGRLAPSQSGTSPDTMGTR